MFENTGRDLRRTSDPSEDEQSRLVCAVLELLSSHGAGLTGLIKMFHHRNLEHLIASWVGRGENLPITPQELEQGIGKINIEHLADDTGLAAQTVRETLTTVLPNIVDELTPEGELPESGILEQRLKVFQSRLGM